MYSCPTCHKFYTRSDNLKHYQQLQLTQRQRLGPWITHDRVGIRDRPRIIREIREWNGTRPRIRWESRILIWQQKRGITTVILSHRECMDISIIGLSIHHAMIEKVYIKMLQTSIDDDPPIMDRSYVQKNPWYQMSFKSITVTSLWARWRLKSPASRGCAKPFVQALIKEYIKALCHWPLRGEFTGDQWIPRTKGQ